MQELAFKLEGSTHPHSDLLYNGSKIHQFPSLITGLLPGLLCQWRCPEKHTERNPGQWDVTESLHY